MVAGDSHDKKVDFRKILIVSGIIVLFVFYYWFGLDQYLSLDSLKNRHSLIKSYYLENPKIFIGAYILLYIVSTALSFPGATILTLAGGSFFGLWLGTIVVSISSTLGASLSFLTSRFLIKDFIQRRFKTKLVTVNEGIEREGAFYLFALRLSPVFPFFVINLMMGLTSIKMGTYFFISLVGMLPGTIVYVNAGTQISKINSIQSIFSPQILYSFMMMAILPLLSKWIFHHLRKIF